MMFFQDLLLNLFSARSSVVVESQIWFWRPSRARRPLEHSMAAAKLSFAQDTPQGHSQAPIQKSRFHFSKIMVPLCAARALNASTNRYAFCSRGPAGSVRAAIVSGPVPSAQVFLSPRESSKIFRLPIFCFQETGGKSRFRLIYHFLDLQGPQAPWPGCLRRKAGSATDCPDDCRHFGVFHVTMKFSWIMGTEKIKNIFSCRKHITRFPVGNKFIRHLEPCQINYLWPGVWPNLMSRSTNSWKIWSRVVRTHEKFGVA